MVSPNLYSSIIMQKNLFKQKIELCPKEAFKVNYSSSSSSSPITSGSGITSVAVSSVSKSSEISSGADTETTVSSDSVNNSALSGSLISATVKLSPISSFEASIVKLVGASSGAMTMSISDIDCDKIPSRISSSPST